jgi:DNA-binding transcriptional LysR family regulator
MEITYLRTFVEAAKKGSFSRAAQTLFLSQPAVSGRIQALEEEIGTPLFERRPREVVLTDAGKRFLQYAEGALRLLDLGRTEMERVLHVPTATLRIAATYVAGDYFLPDLIGQFMQSHPSVQTSLVIVPLDDVLVMVARAEADLGIGPIVPHNGLKPVLLHESEYVLAASPGHPLAKLGRPITLAEAATAKLIIYDRLKSSFHYETIVAMFQDAGLIPEISARVTSAEVAKRLIERGLGLAFMQRNMFSRESASGTLVPLCVEGGVSLHIVNAAWFRSGEDLPETAAQFLALVQKSLGKPQEANGAALHAPAPEARATLPARSGCPERSIAMESPYPPGPVC